ncbi:MAG: hypothetical protein ABJE47_20720 [bacterium]
MTTSMKRAMLGVAATSALVLLNATPSGAQQAAAHSRWEAWIGCWSAAPNDALIAAPTNAPVVCITPASDIGPEAVDLTTIAAGKIVSADHIDASGRDWSFDNKGCAGSQRATRSADGRRVYLKSTSSCNGIPTSTSAVLSMTPAGEWLDVRSVTAGGGENVRTARYHEIQVPISVPQEIADALKARSIPSTLSARASAGASVDDNAVIEATHAVDQGVVEAWLLERGQKFSKLDARELVKLADAGVPERITDAMIAVSNPTAFAFARGGDPAMAKSDESTSTGQKIYVTMEYDPWRYGYSNSSSLGYLYSPYGYGYGLGNGYGYGYGIGGYGTGYSTGYYPPIVVVNGSNTPDAHGKVIKGRGYTQGPGSSSSGTGYVAPASSGSSSGSTSSGSTGSSASTAPASAPAASTETRTAKPRSP